MTVGSVGSKLGLFLRRALAKNLNLLCLIMKRTRRTSYGLARISFPCVTAGALTYAAGRA
jgi:hypothetical protein